MKAKKDKSGGWVCRAYFQDVDGKVYQPRFRAERKAEAEQMAAEWVSQRKKERETGILSVTFEDAANRYIKSRENIISPSTAAGYNYIIKNHIKPIASTQLPDIRNEEIQRLVNLWAGAGASPKAIRNRYAFITAVFNTYRPAFVLSVKLPASAPPKLYTPNDNEIMQLISSVRGSSLEIPVLLAALGGMRRSEICALTADDVSEGRILINKALVRNDSGEWVIKSPKTEAGYRTVFLPKEVTDRIIEIAPAGRVVNITPPAISKAFSFRLKREGLPPFRFHSLRSYYASSLHAIGVPDKYIMSVGGWHDEKTLQEHYKKTLPDKMNLFASEIVGHFSEIYSSNKLGDNEGASESRN